MNEPAPTHGNAPVRHGEEWANALTHGLAALMSLVLGTWLVLEALPDRPGLALACAAYIASVFATFSFSTLSHAILQQPLLDTLRAWDQAMIYAMISGTYTPIVFRYAPDAVRTPLLTAIWVAAFVGIAGKLLMRHRVNNVATVSYLLLGWLPAIPLYGKVPSGLGWGMLLGGVLYTLGVIVLVNDSKFKYLHVVWHLFVISAALCHFLAIQWYVVR
ncbi:hemolysin III family protein [Stieleria sp.]|uniref:PAQR family membrane homeostasis protein TrhA n=1 Tax=Stieleria sp. TaxID=2795976 RepID=UPI003561DF54